MWSRWVWVSTIASTFATGNSGWFQLRWRSALSPWNIPESTSTRRPPASSRYWEPVTVRAAPRKVSLAMALGLALLGHALRHQLAQHGLQDAAVAVVIDLDRRVEPRGHHQRSARAVGPLHLDRHVLARLELARKAADRERLAPGEARGLGARARLELQRQDAHADQVRAVDALVALGDRGAYAEQQRALGGPVARAAAA